MARILSENSKFVFIFKKLTAFQIYSVTDTTHSFFFMLYTQYSIKHLDDTQGLVLLKNIYIAYLIYHVSVYAIGRITTISDLFLMLECEMFFVNILLSPGKNDVN